MSFSSTNLEHTVWYLVGRACLWAILAVVQIVHVVRTQTFGSCPRALAVALAAGSSLFAFRDLVTTIFYASSADALLPVQQTIDCLAEAYFLGVLMVIAAGYCITTNHFDDAKRNAFILPVGYFVVTAVFTFMNDYLDSIDVDTVSNTFSLLYVLLLFGQLALLMVMWFAIFDSSDNTYKTLAEQQARRGLRPPLSPTLGDAEAQIDGAAANGAAPAPTLEEPSTVAEAVDLNVKYKLIQRFRIAVALYMLATIVAILLPIFLTDPAAAAPAPAAPGAPPTPASYASYNATTIVLNVFRVAFMVFLAWVFRLRPDSPYLLVNEETDTVPLDTSLGSAPIAPRQPGVSDVQMTELPHGPHVAIPAKISITKNGVDGGAARQRSPRRSPRRGGIPARPHTVSDALTHSREDSPHIDAHFKLDDAE